MANVDEQQLERRFTRAGLLSADGQPGPTTLTCRQARHIAAESSSSLREVECYALDHGIVPPRYASNLGSFTLADQRRLLESRVLVVGLGGLGGNVVEQLARAGVGRITAADPDTFEEKNLNRQNFCTLDSLGQPKVREVARRLRQINPAVEFSGCAMRFQQLGDEVFGDLDIVFDCLDSVADRLALEAECAAKNVVLIHGAAGGWFGQVGMARPNAGLLRAAYGQRRRGVEQSLGNPPFMPAVVASLAVALGIKTLLGKTLPRDHLMRFVDLLSEEWATLCLASD